MNKAELDLVCLTLQEIGKNPVINQDEYVKTIISLFGRRNLASFFGVETLPEIQDAIVKYLNTRH